MDKLTVGTIVKIVKKVDRWGTGTTWPKVDYELVGAIGVVKKAKDDEIAAYGYNLALNNDRSSTYWFPRESLEIHENQNILLLKINGTAPYHIMIINTGEYVLEEATKAVLKFRSLEKVTEYIDKHYDQIDY